MSELTRLRIALGFAIAALIVAFLTIIPALWFAGAAWSSEPAEQPLILTATGFGLSWALGRIAELIKP